MNFLQYLLEKDEEYKRWITIFPGGKYSSQRDDRGRRRKNKGIHVLINGKDGTILGGMGGKFDGENIKDVRNVEERPKSNREKVKKFIEELKNDVGENNFKEYKKNLEDSNDGKEIPLEDTSFYDFFKKELSDIDNITESKKKNMKEWFELLGLPGEKNSLYTKVYKEFKLNYDKMIDKNKDNPEKLAVIDASKKLFDALKNEISLLKYIPTEKMKKLEEFLNNDFEKPYLAYNQLHKAGLKNEVERLLLKLKYPDFKMYDFEKYFNTSKVDPLLYNNGMQSLKNAYQQEYGSKDDIKDTSVSSNTYDTTASQTSSTYSSVYDEKIEKAKKRSIKAHESLDASKLDLTKEERSSLYSYTGSAYNSINSYLRRQIQDVDYSTKEKIKNIDSAFSKSSVKKSFVTYRGMNLTGELKDLWFNSKPGDTIGDKGFVSTTTNPNKSFSGNIKLEIVVPKGSKAISVKSLSMFEHEDEILLNRGGKFKVIKNERSGNRRKIKVVYIPNDN